MRPTPGPPAPSGVGEREGASSGGLSSGGLSSKVGEREGASSGGSLLRGCLLWAGRAGGSRLRGSLRCSSADPLASPGSAATFLLCRPEAPFLPSAVLLVPSLCPGFSRLLPARLETQASQGLPSSQWAVLAPPSSLRAGLTGCLGFITETFLPRSFLHS